MNYQLFSPVVGLLRLLLAAVLLCFLGVLLELLWFAATDSTDDFWRFGTERIAFALASTTISCVICALVLQHRQPPERSRHARNSTKILAFVAFGGAVAGLALWEMLQTLTACRDAADLLSAFWYHYVFCK